MKQEYTELEIEIIEFDMADIITTSGPQFPGNPLDPDTGN